MGHSTSSEMSTNFFVRAGVPTVNVIPDLQQHQHQGGLQIPQANRAPLTRGVSPTPSLQDSYFSLGSVQGNHNFSQLINVETLFSLQASAHVITPFMYALSGYPRVFTLNLRHYLSLTTS